MSPLIRFFHRVYGSNYQWFPFLLGFLLALVIGAPLLAQEEEIPGWRVRLVCPDGHQVRPSVQYCFYTRDNGLKIHVIGVDLNAPGVRIEYLIPKGRSHAFGGLEQCRDPNRPEWGSVQGGGCYVPDNLGLYPVMPLISENPDEVSAFSTAREVFDSPGLAAIINADYMADSRAQDHGPEGLLIVAGERFDGADRCDSDYNAVLRPWLAVGKAIDPETGRLPVLIGNLEKDGDEIPFVAHTGVGGGPWLIKDSIVNEDADACTGTLTLNEEPGFTNCLQKTPVPSAQERYRETYGGSCYRTAHSAAGLSQDGRWLFFVMNEGDANGMLPEELAGFMKEQLDVRDAIKFDGGRSAKLWVGGTNPAFLNPTKSSRQLSSFLAIYAGLPPQATAIDSVTYAILDEGEPLELDPTFRNDGDFTWKAEDDVALSEKVTLGFGRYKTHALPKEVPPGESISWNIPIDSSGVKVYRFQMVQNGAYFGEETQFLVVGIPEALQERRDEIEREILQIIEEAQAQGEQQLEELARRLQEWLMQEAQKMAENALTSCFNSLAIILILPGLAVVFRYRRQ